MNYKLFIFLLLITCANPAVIARQTKEDSLKTAFLIAKEDTAKRNKLKELVNLYATDTKSPNECFKLLQTLIKRKDDSKMDYLLLLFIAGIVDIKKFAYDICGDTVNIA